MPVMEDVKSLIKTTAAAKPGAREKKLAFLAGHSAKGGGLTPGS